MRTATTPAGWNSRMMFSYLSSRPAATLDMRAKRSRMLSGSSARPRRRCAWRAGGLPLSPFCSRSPFWQAKVARAAQAEAESTRAQAQSTRAQADVDIALVYQQGDDAVDPRTLAHLARASRTLPNDPLPRQYVVSLFRDRLWYLALMEPLRHK